jgi:hypothetical protein
LTDLNENNNINIHASVETSEIPDTNEDDAPNDYYDNTFFWKNYNIDLDLSDL